VHDFGETSVDEKTQGPPVASVKVVLGSSCQLVEKLTSNLGNVDEVVVVVVVVPTGIVVTVVVVVEPNNCVCQLEF